MSIKRQKLDVFIYFFHLEGKISNGNLRKLKKPLWFPKPYSKNCKKTGAMNFVIVKQQLENNLDLEVQNLVKINKIFQNPINYIEIRLRYEFLNREQRLLERPLYSILFVHLPSYKIQALSKSSSKYAK